MGTNLNSPSRTPKFAEASVENISRIFSLPENEDSTLSRIDQEISANLQDFLKNHIIARETPPHILERDFSDTLIPSDPIFVSEQADFLLEKVVAQSVHVSSPRFVGHMTSALPYFMMPLAKVMIALNQNLNKIETSKAFTPLERQVTAMLHRLVFNRKASFYKEFTHHRHSSIGAFTSCGTVANITALWVARNRALAAKGNFGGIRNEGIAAAYSAYGVKGAQVFVSDRGHYSISKGIDLLGIGRNNLVSIPVDSKNKINISKLEQAIQKSKDDGFMPLAVIGIAGTTETGSVDPLAEMAAIAEKNDIWFHVDAAWGGPAYFSEKYRPLLKGADQANSITFDAHKQLFVPIGAGLCLFKKPSYSDSIKHTADYIIRKESRDLGRFTLEGSRPGISMLVHSALRIIGSKGYEILVDRGINLAKKFAQAISEHPNFELITPPELNILTYRYVPEKFRPALAEGDSKTQKTTNTKLNRLTEDIQKSQRAAGKSFVSRTTLHPEQYGGMPITVFRVVLANPLTEFEYLVEMLGEQANIGERFVK